MRILYVDAYDSFTNNIIGLLESSLGVTVTLVKIDDSEVAGNLKSFLSGFDAVVVGPGPGDPRIQKDIGFINQLWALDEFNLLPILGICLGFQSLALAFGASVKRLPQPHHGRVNEVSHHGVDIFEGVDAFRATQYHSLCVKLGNRSIQDSTKLPAQINSCPMLEPLAWDNSNSQNGVILQAIRHTTKPFWGLQYHPESICTTEAGSIVVSKWWMKSLAWLSSKGRIRQNNRIDITRPMRQQCARMDFLEASSDSDVTDSSSSIRPESPDSSSSSDNSERFAVDKDELKVEKIVTALLNTCSRIDHLQAVSLPSESLTITKLCEELNLPEREMILLDSQETSGRFSILGLVIPTQTLHIAFTMHDRCLTISCDGEERIRQCFDDSSKIWILLQRILDMHAPRTYTDSITPFQGGLMGYVSYEASLGTIGVYHLPKESRKYAPDLSFAVIQRSIVIDHVEARVYIQSLLPEDSLWLSNTSAIIKGVSQAITFPANHPSLPLTSVSHKIPNDESKIGLRNKPSESQVLEYFKSGYIERPSGERYRRKVLECQEALCAGDSYELCLTDQTTIVLPKSELLDHPWTLYKHLRKLNPAPFGAYLRLGALNILSSSPERFLSWDRNDNFQMRPIKGTVKKSENMTYDLAKSILDSSKERAENLMIVDLVRHDLSGVIGAQNVEVSKLMQVEEYETVYQLVSVIEGRLPGNIPLNVKAHMGDSIEDGRAVKARQPNKVTGIDILSAVLPPGSMTGAPKKRSCELLQEIEEHKSRSVYSGVLGYMDVQGGGDFSIVIRTAFRWDDEVIWRPKKNTSSLKQQAKSMHDRRARTEDKEYRVTDNDEEEMVPHRVWRIGAGGAVTVQSTAQGEFEEMETKLESVLKIFQPT